MLCPICHEILEDPHLINCPSNCVACKKCIHNLFRLTPGQSDEVEIGVKCLCNAATIFKQEVKPDIMMNRLVKNIIIRCPNHLNGCSWFSNRDTPEDILEQHTRNCRYFIWNVIRLVLIIKWLIPQDYKIILETCFVLCVQRFLVLTIILDFRKIRK